MVFQSYHLVISRVKVLLEFRARKVRLTIGIEMTMRHHFKYIKYIERDVKKRGNNRITAYILDPYKSLSYEFVIN